MARASHLVKVVHVVHGNNVCLPPDGFAGVGRLLSLDQASRRRTPYSLNLSAPACLRTLEELYTDPKTREDLRRGACRHLGSLASLGLITADGDGVYTCAQGAVVDGRFSPEFIYGKLAEYPGLKAALTLLETDKSVENMKLGLTIKVEVGAPWRDETADGIGGDFRSWARVAGVEIETARRRQRPTT
jgi:hypothetical protein